MILNVNWHTLTVAILLMVVGGREGTVQPRQYDYVDDSCLNLMPSQMMEANIESRAGEASPFSASFVSNSEAMYTYRPNHEYRVVISSAKDDFMGFIANMRLASNPDVIVGSIKSQGMNPSVKTMICNGSANTATQMAITNHSSVEFIWTAPSNLNEAVMLRFGVFKNLTLFWNNLHTPCIVPEDVNVIPSICKSSSVVPASSSLLPSRLVTTSVISEKSSSVHHGTTATSSLTYSSSSILLVSSSTISKSASKSLSSTRSSSLLPPPSLVPSHSVFKHVTKRTPIRSILVVSTVFTYTYTSISIPSPVPSVTIAGGAMIIASTTGTSTVTTLSVAKVSAVVATPSSTSSSSLIVLTSSPMTTHASSNLSAFATAVTDSNDESLFENTSEVMAIGIAVGFVLLIIALQVVIVIVGCVYRSRRKKSRSRSSSFRTLYSLDTASVRSESIRRSHRLYSRENCQLDLKLNIIEVDERTTSSVPCTQSSNTSDPAASVEVHVNSTPDR